MAGPLRNGWTDRIDAVRAFVRDPGGVAVLVLIFLLGMIAGWIPSPLADIAATLHQHDRRVNEIILIRAQTDARLAEILTRLTGEIEKQNKRAQIRECAEISDRELQRRCLE